MPRTLSTAPRSRFVRDYLAAVAVALAASAHLAAAQDVPNRDAAVEIRTQFLADLEGLQGKFLALAEAIPSDKYAWRPAPGVRSVGEAFMHVAGEFYTYAPAAYGAAPSPIVGRGNDAYAKFEAMSSKPEVLKHLKESFTYSKQAIGALDPAAIAGTKKIFGGDRTIVETSFGVVDDLHEHLGQLIAYARVNGVKPPWSK